MTANEKFARDAVRLLRAVERRNRPPEGYLGTEKYELLGVYKKDLEHIGKELMQNLPGDWIGALNLLRASNVFEAKTLALDIAVRKKKEFQKNHWTNFSKWLDDCEGWAMVDGLCCDVLSLFITKWPDLIDKSATWSRSKNLWKRRASIVLVVRPVRTGQFADELFVRMSDLAGDHDPMIYKAVSWGLRSAIATQREEVESFLQDHEQVLKPAVIREVRTKLDTGRKNIVVKKTKAEN
ncbi:MAG: DNA alkylation repair protein [Calditrichaeota bacterium]|nr:DNA alkylation repair protein [Calditrichota bacterium]MCB9369778.1 DNA alkylation repair protein [Calditrichota bacterium]